MTVADFLKPLRGVQRAGEGWKARCPAHDDRQPSLSVREGKDGKVLVTCFAGCSLKAIASARGVAVQDLFLDNGRHAGERQIVAEYDYRDRAGEVAYQVVRLAPKDFRMRRRDGQGGWTWNVRGVKRMPYRLDQVTQAVALGRRVYIPEGEKDADALAALGLAATTNPGGAGKWHHEYAEVLRGADVVILPDADKPGRDHAAAVAASLQGVAASVKILELPGLPEKGDVSYWLAAGGTRAELERLVEAAAGSEWEGPPIPLDDFDLPSFPTNILPPALRDFVVAEAEATQTAEDLSGMLVLACVATAVQRVVEIEPRPGWREPLSIYVGVTQRPGTRKSQGHADVTAPIREHERREIVRRRPMIEAARSERRILERRLKDIEDKAARADDEPGRKQLIADAGHLAAQLAAMPVVVSPRLLAEDVTTEQLARMLAEQGGRMAVLSPEGGVVFGLMRGRYDREPNFEVYLKGHAGEDLPVDRVGRASDFVRRPALTLGLTIQPDVLRTVAETAEFRGRGLLARFQFAMPNDRLGARRTNPPPVPEHVRQGYHDLIRRLFELSPLEDEDGEHRPYVLRLSEPAHRVLNEFAERLEPELAEFGRFEHMTDWAGKLAGAAVRIAGLLHLAAEGSESSAGSALTKPVSAATMESAIGLAEGYLLPHAVAVFRRMGADPAFERARYILRRLEHHRITESITVRDLFQLCSFGRMDEMRPALAVLEEQGYFRRESMRPLGPAGGRPASQILKLNPYWHNHHNPQNPPVWSNSGGSEGSEGSEGKGLDLGMSLVEEAPREELVL